MKITTVEFSCADYARMIALTLAGVDSYLPLVFTVLLVSRKTRGGGLFEDHREVSFNLEREMSSWAADRFAAAPQR